MKKKIVFYSASSLRAAKPGNTLIYPLRSGEWDRLAEANPDYEICVICSRWNYQLKEYWEEGLYPKPEKVEFLCMDDSADNEAYVEAVMSRKPDIAVAITNMSFPYDWNPIRDSLISEKLEAQGVKTYAQKTFTSIGAFDKWRTNIMLRIDKFPVAKGLYIHRDLFFVEKLNPMAGYNVYKEYVLDRVKSLPYPVIIKGTTGVGSIGMKIVEHFEEAKEIICDENNREDLLVEEFVNGEVFGTEIHGEKGNFSVLPPFRYISGGTGVLNPMASVKYGPITDEQYHIKELQEMLLHMANSLDFKGITQVDLIFYEGKWVIIEINPRWSGSTILTASAERRSAFAIYMDMVTGKTTNYSNIENLGYSVDFKIFGYPEADAEKVIDMPHVDNVWKYHNPVNNSLVLEIVMGGYDSPQQLLEGVWDMKAKLGDYMSEDITEALKGIV